MTELATVPPTTARFPPERLLHPDVHAQRRPDSAAYKMHETGEVVTWRQLQDRSQRCARLFRSHGVEVGGGIALLLDNHPRFLEICWAAQRSGLYFTPISWHSTPSEVAYIVQNSGSSVLLTSKKFAEVAETAAGLLEGVTLLSVDEPFGSFASYLDERDGQEAGALDDEQFGDDMLYTSGTTGRPKGVRRPLSGEPIDRYPEMYLLYARSGFHEDAVHYSAGPLYHASPLHTTMVAMTFGGTVILADHFEPGLALDLLSTHRVTHSNWVPTHFVRLLRLSQETRDRHDLSSLELVLHGAAPCPVWAKAEMIEWVGPIVMEYYGGSEGFGSCLITSAEWLAHRGSVGRAAEGAIHILDEETKEELPAGEIGMVYFETKATMAYHGDMEKTAAARTPQGWATLGDIGHVDADGYLYLADRRADLIITGGVNVYPREVEERLLEHPLIADAAVIGIPDPDFGERVHAVVEVSRPIDDPATFAADVIEHCRLTLAKFKCPRGVDVVAELPRRENGKLYKRLLKDQYRAAASSAPIDATTGA